MSLEVIVIYGLHPSSGGFKSLYPLVKAKGSIATKEGEAQLQISWILACATKERNNSTELHSLR